VGWRTTFVVLALPTFALALLLSKVREPNRTTSTALKEPADEHVSMGEARRRLAAIRSLKRTWIAAFFFGAGVTPFASYLNLYYDQVFHVGSAGRGFLTSLFGVGGIVGLVVGTRYATRWAQRDPGLLR